MNRDYAILSSRYNDLSNLFFQARADQAVLERGQGERLKVLQPASLPFNPSYPNRLALIGGGVALTLVIALAIPFGLFYTDTSFKDSDDIKAEFADVNAIAISRVPEVERRYLNGGSIDGRGSARTAGKWSQSLLQCGWQAGQFTNGSACDGRRRISG